MTAAGTGVMAIRVAFNTESIAVSSAWDRSLTATVGIESVRASICAATASALRDAFLGTSTNAINAPIKTTPPTIPNTITRRSAFLARAAIQR
jgi:hypothetical protein